MPNFNPPKRVTNREKGTDKHLAEKGIDPWMFKLLVRANAPINTIVCVVNELYKVDYKPRAVWSWRKQLLDEWEAEKQVKQ